MPSLRKLGAALLPGLVLAAPAWAEGYASAAGAIQSPTDGWNKLWGEMMTDICAVGVVFGLAALFMLLRYRASPTNKVGRGPKLSKGQKLAWVLVPCALFLADDFMLAAKGWTLWDVQRTVPADAMEVKVTAAQWNFSFDYGNGVETDELVVPVGKPVVLRMSSNDVIHSFGLSEYRLKEDIMPGRITYLWFYPDKPLDTHVVCVGFCGLGHAQMNAEVKAVPKAAFDAWLVKNGKKATSALAPAAPSNS